MNEKLIDHINKLLNLDYFTLFETPLIFKINQDTLKLKYLDLQKQFHPDNFIRNNVNVQITLEHIQDSQDELNLLLVKLSAHINSGYTTLKDPLSRGIELLKQNGVNFDLSKDTKLPEKFLFQQIEFRDNIESAVFSKNVVALEAIESELLTAEKNLILEIDRLFCHGDYTNARDMLKQLAFYKRLKDTLNDAQDIIDTRYN